MKTNTTVNGILNSALREVIAKVELYNGSTTTNFSKSRFKSIEITRQGEQKFFGYGVSQKFTVKFLDADRALNVNKGDRLKVEIGGKGNTNGMTSYNYQRNFPPFYVSEISRDEVNNDLTLVAYDAIADSALHTVNELVFTSTTDEESSILYSIGSFVEACVNLLGLAGWKQINTNTVSFATTYEQGANFEGTESIREALTDIAEVTQTIFYIDSENYLVFKGLDKSGSAVFTIDKSKYFSLSAQDPYTLTSIVHATELGDNVSASAGEGETQYIRDNAFWELRDDIASLVEDSLAFISGLTITPFNCQWRGNSLLEIGDKINLITKDDSTISSYLLDDVITFDGALSQVTQWNYTKDAETESNPSTIGDALKQTFAKVDKANKEISLVASEVDVTQTDIAALQINTGAISASISSLETKVDDKLGDLDADIQEIKQTASLAVTPEQVTIAIQTELDKGVDKVETSTGYTFDEEGLTINKSTSEMKTQITEDGMTVYKNEEAVLTANNQGVDARNLHAVTYLWVGANSRFEDYNGRTGCFWVGGV